MIDDSAVSRAAAYLDNCLEQSREPALVEMLEFVDAFDKVILNREEVNEALKQRPSIFVNRIEGRIVFSLTGTEREITEDDLRLNFEIYIKQFQARYQALKNQK